MIISREFGKAPKIPEGMLELAWRQHCHVVRVMCFDEINEDGTDVGQKTDFYSITPFLPGKEDRITLQDGTLCEVYRAFFQVVTMNDDSGKITAVIMVPSVAALRINKDVAEDDE